MPIRTTSPASRQASRVDRQGPVNPSSRQARRGGHPRRVAPAGPVRPTAVERLEPDTLAHFEEWCRRLTLDNGRRFELERFQLDILEDYFDGCRETLALLPSGNGKTTLFAALALYHLVHTPFAECYIAAASRDQAAYMYRHATGFVARSKGLKKRLKVLKGTKRIESRRDGGFIQVLASNEDTVDGPGPTLALVDELHRHKDDALYVVLLKGLKKRGGRLITCSTAGDDEDSPLGRMRKRGHRLPGLKRRGKYTRGRSRNGAFSFHEWALSATDRRDDMEVVKQANPLSAISPADLLVEHDSMTPWNWARFACGVWLGGEHQAVNPLTWASRGRSGLVIPAESAVSLGIDLGWVLDSTAIVPLWMKSERARWLGKPTVLRPPRGGSVSEDAVLEAIAGYAATWKVERIVFDPNAGGRGLAQKLEDKGFTVVEYSQDPAPMALAASRFDEALREDLIRHPEDEELTAQVLAAVATSAGGEKWRYDKPRTKQRGKAPRKLIDCLTAASIVHAVEIALLEEPPPIDRSAYRMEFA